MSVCLVDSHCHLNYPELALGSSVQAVMKAAETENVMYAQTICTKKSEFPEVLGLAEQHERVFCSFGVHPHHAGEEPLAREEILKYAAHPKVIGIGETGLDYYYEHAPREAQKESFRLHLDAAREVDLPVIIHTREAEEETQTLLSESLQKGPQKLLFHCFSSSRELAEFGVKNGIYISASGIVTFKKSDELRAIFKEVVPLERLLVETDAPYLAPVPHRGKSNQPAYTRLVAECLADLYDVSLDTIADVTTRNFFHLFSKAKHSTL